MCATMSEGTLGKVNEVEAPGELFPIPPWGWALQPWEGMEELIRAQCCREQCFFLFLLSVRLFIFDLSP